MPFVDEAFARVEHCRAVASGVIDLLQLMQHEVCFAAVVEASVL
jgi:hypothetical protein